MITFNRSLDDAQNELEKLTRQYFRLIDKVEKNEHRKSALEVMAESAAKKLEEAKAALEEMERQPATPESAEQLKEQKKQVRSLQTEYNRIGREIGECDEYIRSGNTDIEYTKQKYAELLKEEEKLRQEAETRAAQEKAAREALQAVKESPVRTTADTENEKAGELEKKLQSLPDVAKEASSTGQKSVSKLGKGFLQAAKKLNVFTGLSKAVGPALKKTGEIMKKVFLQTPMEKGLELLRTKMLELAESDRSLNGALESLKSALVSAFMPIYQAALPPLTALLQALTRITQAVGRFIAALFGGTGKQARGTSKALEEETKALKGTGAAAEEAAGSLAAFDEINAIETEDKTGRGGEGGSAGESGSAETPELLSDKAAFLSWGEAFSALLDEILNSGLPRLRKGFERFAGWFNGFSKKLYDMFTFDGVRDKVRRIGRELAAAFNELTAGIDWKTFGAAIGAGLDLAVVLAVSSLSAFDWVSLGESIAEWINGAIGAINWQDVGRLLWQCLTFSIGVLIGFISKLDVAQIINAVIGVIISILSSIKAFLVEADFVTAFYEMLEKIISIVRTLNYSGLATAVFSTVGAAFGAAAEFLWELLSQAWQRVIDWWHEKAFEDGQFTLEGLLDGIFEVAKSIKTWIYEHIIKPFVDGFREAFGIHSPSTVMAELGGYLMDGLLGGILDRFAPVLESVKTVLNGILQFVTGVFTGSWDRAWQGVSSVFRGVGNGIVSTLEGAVNLVIDGVNWMISQLDRLQIRFPSWLGGGSFGFDLPLISGVSIPRLAQGAVVPPNREFMAVLGDNKTETEVVSPLSTMKQAFLEALRESGNAGGRPAELKIYLDRRLLGSALIDEINDRTIQAGRSVLKI